MDLREAAGLVLDQFLDEGKRVYRTDPHGTTLDTENLRPYQIGGRWSAPMGRKKKAAKGNMYAKGLLFAYGSRRMAATFAVPRAIPRVIHKDAHGRRHITFDIRDFDKIRNHVSTESSFDSSNFRALKSARDRGELVSSKPGKPLKTRKIKDPIKHLCSMGWNVNFVHDIEHHFAQIKQIIGGQDPSNPHILASYVENL